MPARRRRKNEEAVVGAVEVKEEVGEANKKAVEMIETLPPDADVEELSGIGKVTGAKLKERGYYTVKDLAYASPRDIEDLVGGRNKAIDIIKAARDAIGFSRNVLTGLETYERHAKLKKISTGVKSLDELLSGGIETGAVTEIVGEFGSGKTQLCHQLAVMVQLPENMGGLNAKAFYIDTENTFRPMRIIQMAKARGLDPQQVLKNIYHARALSSDDQIWYAEQARKYAKEVKLVIVDSAVAHFRAEYPGRENLVERQQKLNRHIMNLLKMAEAHEIAVVVTNQIMAQPDGGYTAPFTASGVPSRPVGGNILAHGATYRIWLRKGREDVRVAKIFDSPYHPEGEAAFRITEAGLVDL